MKNSKVLLIVLIIFISLCSLNAQNFLPKKGILLSISGDLNPKHCKDIALSIGYRFSEACFFASYEFYNEINFTSAYLGGIYYPVKGRFSFGMGAHVGEVNRILGLGILLEESIWATKRIGFALQQKLLSNGSIGQYYENRVLFYFIL